MTATATSLPAGYEALKPFVASWAVPGSARRAQRRSDTSSEERLAFFNAVKPLIGPALTQLDQKKLTEFDPAEQRLMDMMLAFAHVALAIEMQGDAETRHATSRAAMVITKSPADA
jgi:hypothetical protein